MEKGLLLMVIGLSIFFQARAQKDSFVQRNGNIPIGKIKAMDKGILTIKPEYSENDFKVTWGKIKRVSLENIFLITLTDDCRFNGRLNSVDSSNIQKDHCDPILILKLKHSEVYEK